ncbi:MAG TPA: YciI family protein [Pseudonocardia sp.]|uniref:YciI family protein n=1 Tax=Pseudonocardia sp. TaxID=60912 RepID=UPI002B4B3CB9|nr:YciI family protein [Pseudonocardia sp.]HLU58309.1 YciI family protein [Pseudonocardia sp.]
MKYLLLIYGAPEAEPQTPEAVQELVDEYWAYEAAAEDAGVFIASQALQGVETATTVQVRDDGERIVTDGPFAETREVLGGYYLVDVPDLDAALDWAARCPGAKHGSRIEVRPVHEFERP